MQQQSENCKKGDKVGPAGAGTMKQHLRLDGTRKRLLRPSVVEDQVDSFRMQLLYLLGSSLT